MTYQPEINYGEDHAKNPGRLPLEKFNRWLLSIQDQPEWRVRADLECDYYDSKQLDNATLNDMKERGIPPIVVNLIAPTVNLVLGLEAKTRTDFKVEADDPATDKNGMGVALTEKLNDVTRMTRAHTAISDAFAGQIKAGLAWVYVGRNYMNPFGPKYKIEAVNRREIWWDWHAKDPMLRDARFLMRRKWLDKDIVMEMFPEHKELIRYASSNWAEFDPGSYQDSVPLMQDNLIESQWAWDELEWRDSYRERINLYEIWYRMFERGYIMRLPDDRVVEVDRNNPLHVALITSGRIMPEISMIPRVRVSFWMGPHRLYDFASPYDHYDFPYTPFWGFREDRTLIPYGMIRSMIPMQDEVNARRSKMLWQLSATRVIADEDAVHDHATAQAEVSRPDAYIKLNGRRRNTRADAFRIEEHQGLSAQQFQVYVDSKDTMQDTSGVYKAQLGKTDKGADSGIAINSLIEQGSTTLAEITDNYRLAKMEVGEQLMSMVKSDLAKQENVEIMANEAGRKRQVFINKPEVDPATGQKKLNNDVTIFRASVALGEAPDTPSYRQMVFQEVSQVMSGLAPEAQVLMLDLWISTSSLPFKDVIAERVRRRFGIDHPDPASMSDEEKAQAEAQAQSAQEAEEMQKRIAQLEADIKAAEIRETHAKADLAEARADSQRVEANLPVNTAEPVAMDIPGAVRSLEEIAAAR